MSKDPISFARVEKAVASHRKTAMELTSLYHEHGMSFGMRDEHEKCSTIVTGTLRLLLGSGYDGVDEIASDKR